MSHRLPFIRWRFDSTQEPPPLPFVLFVYKSRDPTPLWSTSNGSHSNSQRSAILLVSASSSITMTMPHYIRPPIAQPLPSQENRFGNFPGTDRPGAVAWAREQGWNTLSRQRSHRQENRVGTPSDCRARTAKRTGLEPPLTAAPTLHPLSRALDPCVLSPSLLTLQTPLLIIVFLVEIAEAEGRTLRHDVSPCNMSLVCIPQNDHQGEWKSMARPYTPDKDSSTLSPIGHAIHQTRTARRGHPRRPRLSIRSRNVTSTSGFENSLRWSNNH
ncbi:hypothetical protein EW146_g7272 [Bondarzewia mesenterica]|uniref:Uncharacterized protein n=1 Tax=Bondarzewia mesenterica TaxID=1095465 RepID=A0A4S4LN29_9AGAM|nr:hypothetical protein EW146_g7272 [Bondarzewia mesenterica]